MNNSGASGGALLRAEVEDLDHAGRGVARVDGKVVFIAGALPGEVVHYRRLRRRSRHDEGRVDEILQASAARAVPPCPYVERCGGCSLQHLEHQAQVLAKQNALLASLKSIARLSPDAVLPPVVAEPWSYRRKARLGVKYVPGKGGVLVGFREKYGSKIADMHGCEVLASPVGGLIAALRQRLSLLDARARIPQIEVAIGDQATALVFRHLDPLSEGDREHLKAFAREHGVQVHLQPGGSESVVLLWPPDAEELTYRLPEHDVVLGFSALDFVQVNAAVNRALVSRALELLAPDAGEKVLDLFCGLGNFTLPLARRGARLTGLEGSATLVERARANALRNGIANADFRSADLSDEDTVKTWLRQAWDKLLLDPPRSGALLVVEALAAPLPRRIVYISCHPGTLARDTGVLVHRHGYRLRRAGVVDMFPHTNHMESVAVFERSPAASRGTGP